MKNIKKTNNLRKYILKLVFLSCFAFLSSCLDEKKEVIPTNKDDLKYVVNNQSSLNNSNLIRDNIDSTVFFMQDSIIYHDDGINKKWHLQLLEGELEGECISYYKTGVIKAKENFKKGFRSGIKTQYTPKGDLYIKSLYDKGCLKWKEFYNNHEVYMKSVYDENQKSMIILFKEEKIDTGYVTGKTEKACEEHVSVTSLTGGR